MHVTIAHCSKVLSCIPNLKVLFTFERPDTRISLKSTLIKHYYSDNLKIYGARNAPHEKFCSVNLSKYLSIEMKL